jgi:HSP20 family molecular chaperone IbpA
VGWLERLLGRTDAVKDAVARARANVQAPRFSETDTELVFTSEAPGLKAETVTSEPEGSSLRVKASGEGRSGEQLVFDERVQLPEGSDPAGATVSYEGTQLIVRIPKTALHRKTHADSVDDDETVGS